MLKTIKQGTVLTDTSNSCIFNDLKCVQPELDRVTKVIKHQLNDCGQNIKEFISTLNATSGKMLRPALVLLSAAAAGSITDEHIYISAVFELMHAATLFHDDVIDQANFRRGQKTINILYGNERAVLAGDFFLCNVLKMSVNLRPKMQKLIASTSASLCRGELAQAIQRQNFDLTEKEYINIITEKTASFFANCCYAGAFLAGRDQKQSKLFSDFGLNFGIGFQMADDLMDMTGDEKSTGKPAGNDLKKNKPTLAIIHLLRAVDQKKRQSLLKKLKNFSAENNDLAEILDLLNQYHSLKYAKEQARSYVNKAENCLKELAPGLYKNSMLGICRLLLNKLD